MAKKAALAREVAGRSYDISGYRRVKTAGGYASYDCGDSVAKTLAGQDLKAVYEKASKALGVSALSLKRKYSHLNAGMQRMALGNRMRKGKPAA